MIDGLNEFVSDLGFDIHGVPAMVRVRGETAWIDTTLVWIAFEPIDGDFKESPRRLAVLKKSEVPELFKGDQIDAVERVGCPMRTWVVDGFTDGSDGTHRVIVHAAVERE